MREISVTIDLTHDSVADIGAGLDRLDALMASGRLPGGRYCHECWRHVPAQALICWNCQAVLSLRGG